MKTQYWIAIFGIVVIAALEAFALHKGIDGTAFAGAAAGVGGIVGYVLKGGRK